MSAGLEGTQAKGRRRLGARIPPPLAYGALAVVVAGPALRPGLVLAVDLAQTPRSTLSSAYWGLPAGTNSGSLGRLPLDGLWRLAGTVGLVPVAQKLLLLAIVVLAGFGMHRLARGGRAGRYFAGTLYAVNPFVYERLIAGQWFLLLGYALLPWAFAELLAAGEGRRWAPWRFALLSALVGFADAHMAVLLGLLCLLTVVIRARPQGRAALGRSLLALGLAGCTSLLWLLPTPGLHELWRHVGHAQLGLYGTVSDPRWGPVLTVLGLGGFWNDPAPAATALAVWPLFVLALLALALRGAATERDRPLAVAVGLAGAVGAIAALGTSSAATRPVTFWLMDHLPALRSFRETDKTVALLAFAYAMLGAGAVDELAAAPRRRTLAVASALLAVALPIVYGAHELGGGGGALRPVSFPPSWRAADALLRAQAGESRTLFLPFQGYLHLSFAHSRVTYNPAPSYFATSILAGRSVDADPAHQDVRDPEQEMVQTLLAHPARPDLGRCLAALGVSHVLLARDADGRSLAALTRRADMRVEASWPDLTLIALRRPGSFAMTAPAPGTACPHDLRPVRSRLVSPVRLRLGARVPPGRRLVLGLPDAFAWTRRGSDVRFAPWGALRGVYALALAGWAAFALSAAAARAAARHLTP